MGDSVRVQDMSGYMQRSMRLLEKPGSPTVTDNIRVMEGAREILYRPVKNGQSQRRSGCLLCARSLSDLRCSAATLETRCVLIGQLLARLPSASLTLQPQWHVACEEARDEVVGASHSGEQ